MNEINPPPETANNQQSATEKPKVIHTFNGSYYVQKYTTTDGRLNRLQYLMGFGACLAMVMILVMVYWLITDNSSPWLAIPVLIGAFVFLLAICMILASVIVRRLQDIGQSGWWGLLLIVPYVNIILIITIALVPGSKGPNPYGVVPS